MQMRRIVFGRSVLLTGLAIGLVTQATAQQSQSTPTNEAAQKRVEGLIGRYTAAVDNKDAAGVAALFAEDGVLLLAVPNTPLSSGRQAIQKFYEGAFKTGLTDLHTTVDDTHTAGDIAWARGSFDEMRGAMSQGGAPERVHGMWSAVYERAGGDYEIKQLTAFILPSAPAAAVGSSTPPANEGTSSK
jgi:uncharacterized protein (TIGR02246 family)